MWFLDSCDRLNRERQAIDKLGSVSPWLEGASWRFDSPNVVIDADIVLENTQRFSVRLIFPELYPSVPPAVLPKEPSQWSSHQYGVTGELCLELGPDNWHPENYTSASMLESTYRLLRLEVVHEYESKVEIPSRHKLTDGQLQRYQVFRWVLASEVREVLDSLPDEGIYGCDVFTMLHENALMVFLQQIEYSESNSWEDCSLPKEISRLGGKARGLVLTKQFGMQALAELDMATAMTLLLESQLANQCSNIELDAIKFVFLKDAGGDWQVHWRGSADSVSLCSTVISDTAPAEKRNGLDVERLSNSSVAIVGCGSAGSKIAASLARSGVGKFFLLDDDLMHQANLVRHDCDWVSIGQHKVEAVAERIALINPSVEVNRRIHRLNGQESSTAASAALIEIGQADLIIDATADPSVFNLCAHVARIKKTPLLWLEVFAGGIGGLIARSRPDEEAEPFTLRQAIMTAASELAEKKGVELPKPATNYAYFDSREQIIVASDCDVTTIAGQAAQMAIDTLLDREQSHFPFPAYLVGFSKGWVFEQAFHTIPISCTASVDWTTVVQTDDAIWNESIAFIRSLLKEENSDGDTESAE